MALQKQPVEIVFEQGPDTKTDPKIVPAGKLLALENYAFRNRTLKRIPGSVRLYDASADTETIKPGPDAMLATLRGQLLVRDKLRLYPYSETTGKLAPVLLTVGTGAFVPGAHVPPASMSLERKRVAGSLYNLSLPNVAELDGVTVATWEISSGNYSNVVAFDKDGVVLAPVQTLVSESVGTPTRACPVALDDCIAVFSVGGTALKVRILRMVQPIRPYGLEGSISVEATDNYYKLDAAPSGDGNAVVAVVRAPSVTGTRTVRMFKVNRFAVATASQTLNTYTNTVKPTAPSGNSEDSVGVAVASDGTVFCAYAVKDSSGHLTIRAGVRSADLATAVTAEGEVIDITDIYANADTPRISIGKGPGADDAFLCVEVDVSNGGQTAAHFVLFGVLTKSLAWAPSTLEDSRVLTKPFRMGSGETLFAVETPALYDSSLSASNGYSAQRAVEVINHRNFIVSRMAAGEAITQAGTIAANVSVKEVDGRLAASFPIVISGQQGAGERAAVAIVTLSEDSVSTESAKRLGPVEYGGSVYFPGAILRQFDGNSLFETGFHPYFDQFTVTWAVGSGSVPAGSYLCAVVLEMLDASGELHQSAPFIKKVTLSSDGDITWSFKTTVHTDKPDVRLALYRSETNGSTLYRLQGATLAVGTTSFPDTVTAVDASGPFIYTTGGVLPALPPPPCRHLSVHEKRLGLVSSEDNALWFSQKYIPGIAPRFHPDQAIRSTGNLGQMIAAASMPGRWALLYERGLEFTTGDGPNELGTGGAFTEPQEIPSPTGTHAPQSVISTPVGVFFRGETGIWLLKQDLSLEYVGQDVEAITGTITAAVHVPEHYEVRFFQSDPAVTLVYNYMQQQWATLFGRTAVSAVLWKGKCVTADSLSEGYTSVSQENADAVAENGQPIQSAVETAWFKVGGLHGFQRVWWVSLLGTHRGDCLLTIKMAFDDEPQFSEEKVRHYTSDESAVAGRPLKVRFKPARQKCSSIRFRIECDGGGDGPSGGVDLTSIGLELGVKAGFKTSQLKTLGRQEAG